MSSLTISYDRRSFILNGRRQILFSGSIHYWRSEPQAWNKHFAVASSAGINAVETYIYWGLHETSPGTFDFNGRLNLEQFSELAQKSGLLLFLRLGPYICAEVNYGGLPMWLRRDGYSKLRTADSEYLAAVTRWFEKLTPILQRLSCRNGGPLFAVQIENEYGNVSHLHGAEESKAYLVALLKLVEQMGLGVPIFTCDYERFEWGQPSSVLNGINSHCAHLELENHWARFPGQPGVWVENWTGWYDTWGYSRLNKPVESLVSRTARFIAAGGSFINYYMWHGGFNFGREGMYLQATSYDFDAPINEHGLETTKKLVIADFHAAVKCGEEQILSGQVSSSTEGKNSIVSFTASADTLQFVFSPWDNTETLETADSDGAQRSIEQVKILKNGETLFDLSGSVKKHACVLKYTRHNETSLQWTTYPIALPTVLEQAPQSTALAAFQSGSQEYLWYVYEVTLQEQGIHELIVQGAADFLSVYCGGVFVGNTPLPLKEVRDFMRIEDVTHRIPLRIGPGRHVLHILVNNLGWVKGEWSLGYRNLGCERKGIWDNSPTLGGRPLQFLGYSAWQPFSQHSLISKSTSEAMNSPAFHTTEVKLPSDSCSMALSLSGLSKGLLYINGELYCRYWLVPQLKNQKMQDLVQGGQPTQQFYRLPSFPRPATISICLFDEQGASPNSVDLVEAQMHPSDLATFYASRKPPQPISEKAENHGLRLTTTMTGL